MKSGAAQGAAPAARPHPASATCSPPPTRAARRPHRRRGRPRRRAGHRAPGGGRARTPAPCCRRSSTAPGTPSGSRWRPARDVAGTVVVLNGDVPLLRAETLQRAGRGARGGRRRGAPCSPPRWPTRPGWAASCATRHGAVDAHRRGARRHRRAARDPRDQRRRLRLRRGAAARGAGQARPPTTTRARSTSPTCSACSSTPARRCGAHVAADPTEMLGCNDRVQLAALRALLRDRVNLALDARRRHHRRPGDDLDRRDGDARAATRCIEPNTQLRGATTVGDGRRGRPGHHADRHRRSATGASVVRAHAAVRGDRPGRERRPVRLPAAGHGAGANGQGRHVRRGQERRRSGEGTKVPHLSYVGDADDRRADQHRRGQRSSSTTTASAKHHTVIGAHVRTGCGHHVRGAGRGRRRRLHGGRHRDHQGRAAGRARRRRGPSSATSRAGWQRRRPGTTARTRPRPPRRPTDDGRAAGHAGEPVSATHAALTDVATDARPGVILQATRRGHRRERAGTAGASRADEQHQRGERKTLMLFSGRALPRAGRGDRRPSSGSRRPRPTPTTSPTARSSSGTRSRCAARDAFVVQSMPHADQHSGSWRR